MRSGWWKHKNVWHQDTNVWHPDASKPTTGSPTLWQLLIQNPPLQSQLLHLMVKKGLSENCKNLKKWCADEHHLQIALKEYQQGQDGTTTKKLPWRWLSQSHWKRFMPRTCNLWLSTHCLLHSFLPLFSTQNTFFFPYSESEEIFLSMYLLTFVKSIHKISWIENIKTLCQAGVLHCKTVHISNCVIILLPPKSRWITKTSTRL